MDFCSDALVSEQMLGVNPQLVKGYRMQGYILLWRYISQRHIGAENYIATTPIFNLEVAEERLV